MTNSFQRTYANTTSWSGPLGEATKTTRLVASGVDVAIWLVHLTGRRERYLSLELRRSHWDRAQGPIRYTLSACDVVVRKTRPSAKTPHRWAIQPDVLRQSLGYIDDEDSGVALLSWLAKATVEGRVRIKRLRRCRDGRPPTPSTIPTDVTTLATREFGIEPERLLERI